MKLKYAFVLLIVTFSLFSSILTINAHGATQADDTLASIKSKGYITIGADTTYAPFESIDPNSSMPVGFDVDLSVAVAHDMGAALGVKLDVHYQTSAWDPIIPNLQQKKFDIILSAMTITADRAKEVDFSRWYYQSYQAWMVPKDNPKGLTKLSDLNQTGLKVGVQRGTTEDLFMNQSLPNADQHRYDDVPTAIQALKQGSLDVVLGDYAVLALAVHDDPSFIVPGLYSPEYFGIAVRLGDTNLLNAINSALNNLLGSNTTNPQPSDLYNSLYDKWFYNNSPGYTGTVTNAALPTDVVLKYSQGGSTPGFEFLSIFVVALIPIVRKLKVRKVNK